MKLKSKLFASAVAFTMVLGLVAVPVSAQTTAELTAQLNALFVQIAQLQAQIAGGTTGGSSVTFTADLTVGSTGAEVTALQQWLVSKGFLTMPAGVAMGYFGNLTKSAVAAYQASAGISPAVGYFGPITRAKVNALAVVPVTPGTPGTPGTPVVPGTITTPGAEGTITASESSSGVLSTVYEGDSQVAVLGIKLEAKSSDMAFQRLKLDIDDTGSALNDVMVYNKLFKKVYVTDESGNVLGSSDLNSSTVVKDGTDYFITLAGFSHVIPKNTSKIVLVKVDVYPAIDSTDLVAATHAPTLSVAASGVRAVDGAGIDQYSGTTAIAATPVVSADLTDSATLSMSLNSSTPKKTDSVCTSGASENECDKLSLLTFDLKAEKDSVKITDINIGVAKANTAAAGATASTTLYLYDGSTPLAAATVGLSMATFTSFDYTIPKDVTKTFTVKVDVRNANAVRAGFTASASSTGITDENSRGDSVTDSGTATGNEIGVTNVGPEFTLVSKSITTNGVPQDNVSGTASISTSTMTATFNIKVRAVGAALVFGTSQATSTTGAFVSSTTGFTVYRDGSADATISSNATSTSIGFPSTCAPGTLTNSCTLAEGAEITVLISFQLQGRKTASTVFTAGLYSVGIARLQWVYDNASGGTFGTTFMSGETDWRTSEVSFP